MRGTTVANCISNTDSNLKKNVPVIYELASALLSIRHDSYRSEIVLIDGQLYCIKKQPNTFSFLGDTKTFNRDITNLDVYLFFLIRTVTKLHIEPNVLQLKLSFPVPDISADMLNLA